MLECPAGPNWEIYQPGLPANDQLSDGALAVMFNILRELCGPDWTPIDVRFAHRAPAQLQPYRMFFRTTLRFDAEEYALRFSSSWLQRPVAQANAALQRVLQKELDAIAARYDVDFPEQVRSVLPSALLTGHARSDQMAALFSMHSSTLARHLKPYGIGFREMVDECRFDVAREMLSHPGCARRRRPGAAHRLAAIRARWSTRAAAGPAALTGSGRA